MKTNPMARFKNLINPQSSLWIRLISALFAIGILFALTYFWGKDGLKILAFAAVVLGTRELIPILFHPSDSLFLKGLFYILMILIFSVSVKYPDFSSVLFSIGSIVFFSASLVHRRRFEDLESWSLFQFKAIMGFFYLGLLPSFACRILDLNQGMIWFFSYLGIVLGGDTGAYFAGLLFGKTKIMPEVSPKKTKAGMWGGLFGSLIFGFGILTQLSDQPDPVWIGLLCILSGGIGQMGDLFESALKRVAKVKDSGSLMPGHGGILDRVDGLLFAAPIFFLGASLLSRA